MAAFLPTADNAPLSCCWPSKCVNEGVNSHTLGGTLNCGALFSTHWNFTTRISFLSLLGSVAGVRISTDWRGSFAQFLFFLSLD